MAKIPRKSDLASDLAVALIQDIRVSELEEGDRYYTTEEACRKFEVCTDTASRAMKILANRNILVRLRRRGTFVGPMAQPQKKISKKQVIVLTLPISSDAPRPGFNQFPVFLDNVMENVAVQTHIIPVDEDVSFIRELIENALNAGRLSGVVTSSRTREVHEYLAEINTPVVLMGTLDSGQPNLPTLDIDHYQAGRLLAEHLVERGHRHMIVQLANDFGGDHDFVDSIAEVMSAAHLPPSSLKVRMFNGDLKTTQANFRDLFKQKNHPTAVIAVGELMASIADAAMKDVGLTACEDIEITFSAEFREVAKRSTFIHVQPKLGMSEMASLVAKKLEDHHQPEEKHVSIPVELCIV